MRPSAYAEAERADEHGEVERKPLQQAGYRDTFEERLADAVADRLERMHGRRKRVLDIDAAAEYMSLSEDALRDLAKSGAIKTVRPTRKMQFDIYDLDEFILASKTG